MAYFHCFLPKGLGWVCCPNDLLPLFAGVKATRLLLSISSQQVPAVRWSYTSPPETSKRRRHELGYLNNGRLFVEDCRSRLEKSHPIPLCSITHCEPYLYCEGNTARVSSRVC